MFHGFTAEKKRKEQHPCATSHSKNPKKAMLQLIDCSRKRSLTGSGILARREHLEGHETGPCFLGCSWLISRRVSELMCPRLRVVVVQEPSLMLPMA